MALNFPAAPTLNQLYPSPPTAGVPVWRWDGSEWVPNSGNGAVIFSQFEYTASAAQTTFTGADANGATLAYTVGFIEVFVNGSKVNKGDFTATNGTSVVLGSACSANDLITILAFSVNSVANTLAPGNNLSDVTNALTARTNLGVYSTANFFNSTTALTPTSTGSTTGVMMGLGNTFKITPNSSGRVLVTIWGSIFNNTANGGNTVQFNYGTGAAPANAAAPTGTQVTAPAINALPVANSAIPFSATFIVTGLTIGTQYWFDAVLSTVSGQTAGLARMNCTITEF